MFRVGLLPYSHHVRMNSEGQSDFWGYEGSRSRSRIRSRSRSRSRIRSRSQSRSRQFVEKLTCFYLVSVEDEM